MKLDIEALNQEVARLFNENGKSPIRYGKKYFFKNKTFTGVRYAVPGSDDGDGSALKFDFKSLVSIIDFIKGVNLYSPGNKLPIALDFSGLEPRDKLTVNLLEAISYHVLVNLGQKIVLLYDFSNNIVTQQMGDAAFTFLGPKGYSKQTFIEKFLGQGVSGQRNRRIFQNGVDLDKVQFDYAALSQMWGLPFPVAKKVGKLIAELVDNSVLHAQASVIVDLDVTSLMHNNVTGTPVNGLNITIMNFSDVLLFERVRDKLGLFVSNIELLEDTALFESYGKINKALEYHKSNFSDEYTAEHFWTIASLQHHISGRVDQFDTNGVGLTKLVKMIQDYAEDEYGYVASGTVGVWFLSKFMNFNNSTDQFVGFNKSSDFISDLPDEKSLGKTILYLPGTFYNLSFAINTKD